MTDAGVGMAEALCAPSSEGTPSESASAIRRSKCAARSDVDLAELVGRFEHVADLTGKRAGLDGCAVDVADGRLHTGRTKLEKVILQILQRETGAVELSHQSCPSRTELRHRDKLPLEQREPALAVGGVGGLALDLRDARFELLHEHRRAVGIEMVQRL